MAISKEYLNQLMKESAAIDRIGGLREYNKIKSAYFNSKFGGYRDKALAAVKEG